ncbi:SRPBCC family protein [Parasphingorhabdus sp.]|uniref:SRPBCC family protein n=1 Tax=Parasphingorhabdus sp. TaxID=2709688 RepID=UPI003A8E1C3F
MANAETAKRIEAPADRVWEIISGDEMRTLILTLYGESADFEGSGQGAVLTTVLKDGRGTIRERIELIDDEARCLQYRVLDVGPFPYANYRGEIRVTPSGPDACNVSFQTSFIPVEVTAEEGISGWLETNNNMLKTLSEYVS